MYKLEEFPATSLKDEIFARLERVANYANLSPEEQAVYEADLRWISEYDEEMASGKREARAQGLAEGRAEGREEEKWLMAENLVKLGVDLETISKASGIPTSEIKSRFNIK